MESILYPPKRDDDKKGERWKKDVSGATAFRDGGMNGAERLGEVSRMWSCVSERVAGYCRGS